MSDCTIETKALCRSYDGQTVLNGLDLKIKRGSIYGFLGRNGSGKTTTLRILAGLIRPDSGEATVLGGNPWAFGDIERQNVGYLSEKQTLPPLMRVQKLAAFCARFYPAWDHQLCGDLLGRFQIPLRQRVHKLSLGNQRLLGFVLAMAPRPDVLLLDEPAANLDVVARREFLDEILELIRDGRKTVLFSTHILSDVERVADEVGILAGGTLRASAPLDELKDTVKQVRLFEFPGSPPDTLPGALSYRREKNEAVAVLKIHSSEDLANLSTRLGCRLEVHDLSLEDIFIQIAKTR